MVLRAFKVSDSQGTTGFGVGVGDAQLGQTHPTGMYGKIRQVPDRAGCEELQPSSQDTCQ